MVSIIYQVYVEQALSADPCTLSIKPFSHIYFIIQHALTQTLALDLAKSSPARQHRALAGAYHARNLLCCAGITW